MYGRNAGVTESVMLNNDVACQIGRAGIATGAPAFLQAPQLPQIKLTSRPHAGPVSQVLNGKATRAQRPSRCGGGGVRHTQELTTSERLRCNFLEASRHSASVCDSDPAPQMTPRRHRKHASNSLASSRTAVDVKPLWQVFLI